MWPRRSTKSSMPCEKTDPRVQGEARQGRAEGVPVADVGLPPRSGELDTRGEAGAGECVRADPEAEGVVPGSSAVQGNLRYSPRPDHGGALVEGTPPRGRTVGAGPRRVLRDVRSVEDGDPELLRCAPDECLGGGDQHQGAGDHQAGVWAEVGRQPVDAPDPGPESGVGGDRLVDRGDPPDGPRAEGPFRPISRLITEEPVHMMEWFEARACGPGYSWRGSSGARRTRGADKPLRSSTRSMVRSQGSGRMPSVFNSARMTAAPVRL